MVLLIQAGPSAIFAGGFDVQGRLTDKNGVNRQGVFSVKFTVFDAPEGGTALWSKTIRDINIRNGNFQVSLNGADDGGKDVSGIAKSGAIYLEVELLSGAGISSQDGPMRPRQRLSGVPYAVSAQAVEGESLLRGIIAMWSGQVENIPAGWCLCNGQPCKAADGNWVSTPDLTGRFILGAKEAVEVGAIGGGENPVIDPPGAYTSNIKAEIYWDTEPGLTNGASKVRWHYVDIPQFQPGAQTFYPKYFKLAFIMRL